MFFLENVNTFSVGDRTRRYQPRQGVHFRPGTFDDQFDCPLPEEARTELLGKIPPPKPHRSRKIPACEPAPPPVRRLRGAAAVIWRYYRCGFISLRDVAHKRSFDLYGTPGNPICPEPAGGSSPGVAGRSAQSVAGGPTRAAPGCCSIRRPGSWLATGPNAGRNHCAGFLPGRTAL